METKTYQLASKYENCIRDIRHELHKIPEIGLDTFKTSEYIKVILKNIGIPFREFGSKKTGIIATIDNRKNHTIGIRADIDGLQIKEETSLLFRSIIKGQMHACGHDAHAAICLGCGIILWQLRESLDCNIQLIFQPGEEGFGGAKDMIETGFMDVKLLPDEILAVHVSPDQAVGQIGYKSGTITASHNEIEVIFAGKEGHSAQPSKIINPILIASEFISRTQDMAGNINKSGPSVLITFTSIRSDEGYAQTPRHVYLRGNVRCLSMETVKLVETTLGNILGIISEESGCKYNYTFFKDRCYIPGINNPDVVSRVVNTKFKGIQLINILEPGFGSEDFAFFQEVLPGGYFALGCSSEKYPAISPHRSNFIFDESCLKVGVTFFCTYVASYRE